MEIKNMEIIIYLNLKLDNNINEKLNINNYNLILINLE